MQALVAAVVMETFWGGDLSDRLKTIALTSLVITFFWEQRKTFDLKF